MQFLEEMKFEMAYSIKSQSDKEGLSKISLTIALVLLMLKFF